MYDGIVEYWVTVRERGSVEQLHETQEKTASTSKALIHVVVGKNKRPGK